MIFYCLKNHKIGSVLLAIFFSIWSSLFVFQSYAKLCFCIKNHYQNVLSHFFTVEQHPMLLKNGYFLSEEQRLESSILLGTFLPIWSSVFVYQSYVKLCFCIKNHHQNVLWLLFASRIASNCIEGWLCIAFRTIK